MDILLDTHTFIWMVSEQARLRAQSLILLRDMENTIFFSAATSWEITLKRAKGKINFTGSPQAVARKIGLTELAITAEQCEMAAELPMHHRDPFDRVLVAQALLEGLVLGTRDAAMARYGVPILPV